MELPAPNTKTTTTNTKNPFQSSNNVENPYPDPTNFSHFDEEIDSSCSTPYVSAPSSPGRAGGGGGFFYSAPASPMHFTLLSISSESSKPSSSFEFDFDFSAKFGSGPSGSMSSADELFLNGQIRPMKLSSHLEKPQILAPLPDLDLEEDEEEAQRSSRGRDSRLFNNNRSLRRRTRSMSPLRNNASFQCVDDDDEEESRKTPNGSPQNGPEIDKIEEQESQETTPCSSRSSSAGRSSRRWVFLKDFLRSKSEGQNRNNNKFWSNLSFSPTLKEKKPTTTTIPSPPEKTQKAKTAKKPANGLGKRRVPLSAHELHYTANRAQAEELRRKTYLPYRQGLLGCLGFSSKGYGAINGFARALNPVSSR